MPSGKLRVTLTDVRNRRIKEDVDVILRHRTLAEIRKAKLKAGAASTIGNLRGRPQGVYHIFIDPPSYQPVTQFVEISASGVTALDAVCAVNPGKVHGLDLPSFVTERRNAATEERLKSGHSGETASIEYDAACAQGFWSLSFSLTKQ